MTEKGGRPLEGVIIFSKESEVDVDKNEKHEPIGRCPLSLITASTSEGLTLKEIESWELEVCLFKNY